MNETLYIVYDGRAMYDVDEASVFCTADSLDEAITDAKDYGEGVVYRYDIDPKDGVTLINEEFMEYVNASAD